jgi:hypothetical protein
LEGAIVKMGERPRGVLLEAVSKVDLAFVAALYGDCRTLAFLGENRQFVALFNHQNTLPEKQDDL